ncbi:MAG: dicarboxylate/amino acid:cation symporter [Schleiferiaceae bacterium]
MKLHHKILLGMGAGLIWAAASAYLGGAQFTQDWIAPLGTLFINALKLIAVPLVLFSIIDGVGQLGDPKALGRIGGKALGLYLLTTLAAILTGLMVVNVVNPGESADLAQRTENRRGFEAWLKATGKPSPDGQWLTDATAADNLDVADAALAAKISTVQSGTRGPLDFLTEMVPSNVFEALNAGSMLQIIVFAIFFGVVLVLMPREHTDRVRPLMGQLSAVFVHMVVVVMKGAPYFVFALMAGTLTQLTGDDPERLPGLLQTYGTYMLTVLGGLVLILLTVYPTIAWWSTRRAGWSWMQTFRFFFAGMRPAQLLAFSTSSSAATLPVTLECVHDNLKVEEEVSQFTLPIGATINMDGTSLYQAVAVVFLAQFHLVDLSMAQQATIVLTAVAASVGAAAIPSAGLIMLIMVLDSVGLNPAWIALIFPVDRLLDMARTVINVTSDAAVALNVAASEGQWRGAESPAQ